MARFGKKGLPRPYDEYNTYQLKGEPIEKLVREYGQIRKRVLDAFRLAQKRTGTEEFPTGYQFLKNVPPSQLLKSGNVGLARQALIQAAEAYQSPLSSISGLKGRRARVLEALEARGVNLSDITIDGKSVDVSNDFDKIMRAVDSARALLGRYRFDSAGDKRLIQVMANAVAKGVSLDRILESKGRLSRLIADPDRVLTQKTWRKLS